MYAITRILPAVNNKKSLNSVARENIKLMLSYYEGIYSCCLEQLNGDKSDDLMQEMEPMIKERIQFL